ncbi:DUF3732 domain-containing protein [Streptomyces phaeochromogenes]|uniref:DUF3732 domain-containing protein n=1 Tax=Streptomyces phaeochromogenes TaxID=1923 RepID=UPI002E0DE050|nr:DUF3732 domain-containing protein [Streptomyces phaeochromogenes]
MHLLALALYHRDGRPDPRTITFKPGALNVLTGESETGKSAVLDIIEYCLGRQNISLPEGVITQTVGWYALLVEIGSTRLLLGRPRPTGASTNKAMLVIGDNTLELPSAASMSVNADTDGLRTELSARLGIDDFRFEPPPGAERYAFNVSVAQAVYLCLQKQTEIANQQLLFHRQSEQGMAQMMKDTLPYFLGAAGPEQASRQRQLVDATRSLRRIQRQLEEINRNQEAAGAELLGLARLAQDAGMLATLPSAPTAAVLDDLLRGAADAVTDPLTATDLGDDGLQEQLANERQSLREQLQDLNEARTLLDTWQQQSQDLSGELHTQLGRLTSLQLLNTDVETQSDTCPLCNQLLAQPDPDIAQLTELTQHLQNELDDAAALQPTRTRHRQEINSQIADVRARLQGNASSLATLQASNQRLQQLGDQRARQAHIQGRILQELQRSASEPAGEAAALRRQAARMQERVSDLQELVDADDVAAETESRLSRIAQDMTRWARELSLEHAAAAEDVRISLSLLNVVLRTETGRIPLTRIGSAKNWIGYHLVAHLAMHTFLLKHRRPVPHFVMFDQPTQAFFPEEVHDADAITDADWEAVRSYFSLMRDVVDQNGRGLQIIVCDHVNLRDGWFRDAVVENWRQGKALIPTDWISDT